MCRPPGLGHGAGYPVANATGSEIPPSGLRDLESDILCLTPPAEKCRPPGLEDMEPEFRCLTPPVVKYRPPD